MAYSSSTGGGGVDTTADKAAKFVRSMAGLVGAVFLLVGILTERDLLRAVAQRIHSSEARVREWMTADPITATEETSAEEAGRTMLEKGFRHLPVVSGERAVGIVSLRDVAEWSIGSRER